MAGLKGITINTAPEAEPHIYAEDDAAIYQSIFGSDGVTTIGQQCKATTLSNNKVRISDGVVLVGGHVARIPYGEYEDCEIANGQSGKKRNDIIIGKIVTTGSGGIDTMTCEVKQGVAGESAIDPMLTQDNIYQSGKIREIPLYRVKIEGLSIVAVEKMFKTISSIPELEEMLTDLNSKSYEIIKSSKGYVKKYADGRFEAYVRTTIQNAFDFTQIGNSGIYYATFSNAAIGITAVEVTSIITNAANNGVIWSGNAYLNNNNQAVNGMVFQYGSDKTRSTTVMIEVKGRWK